MDIYDTLYKRGLTTSRRDFSTYWACRSPSYLATTHTLSSAAMITVFRRLLDQGHWLIAFRVGRAILFGRHHDEAAA